MPEATVSDIVKMLASVNFDELMAGMPIDWSKVSNKSKVLNLAIHCCINGPVGINKTTSFPKVGETSIKAELPTGATNSGWRKLCEVVAKAVKQKSPDLDCGSKRRSGDLWPIAG